MAATRLNRYLALAGLGTRRSVEGLVRAGRVAVDGVVAEEPSAAVEPGQRVTLDGAPVDERRDRPACSSRWSAARCPRWRIRASCTWPGRRPTGAWPRC